MDGLHITYDETGRPVSATYKDTTQDISAEEQALLPSSKPEREFYDLHTSVRSTLESLQDSYNGDSIIVDIEATHAGYVNQNNYWYMPDGMRQGVDTWTTPYGKPYLVNHDQRSEARGRVVGAKYVDTSQTTGYIALDVRIGHPDEIEMIMDQRALTVSVGSRPVDTVECSVCGHDLYHDGRTPKRYDLESKPKDKWLEQPAPGFAGAIGMTNRDYWDVQTDDDGNTTARCRHMRKAEAPMGDDETHEIFWRIHGMSYNEVSRVNLPADRNEATGEFAHIRSVLEQTDGLDDDMSAKVVAEQLSRVNSGSADRARFQIASEKDLYYPRSAHEAVQVANDSGLSNLFDSGLWQATSAMNDSLPMDEQIAKYWKKGGRFVMRDSGRDTDKLAPAEALKLQNPEDFVRWLSQNDTLSREEKELWDGIYAQRLMRRRLSSK